MSVDYLIPIWAKQHHRHGVELEVQLKRVLQLAVFVGLYNSCCHHRVTYHEVKANILWSIVAMFANIYRRGRRSLRITNQMY